MVALPAGTVTFLFTDIEGSSVLWEADAALMAGVLARHDEILRGQIAQWGGSVFKHTGDGMCAAFAAAPDAVSAAMAAQADFGCEPWPSGMVLRVRMGVHSGTATEVEGDYFGPTLNRAARVMNAGNGGQIVCSAATAALCPGVEMRDAGAHLLPGVGPERLHVVRGGPEGLALRSRSVAPTNLSAAVSSFVGRADALKEVAALLGGARLVTLLGPGGVGKTRLAVEAAAEVSGSFEDGIWFCDLAAVAGDDQVLGQVADTIGARQQPGMALDSAIAGFLERRSTLLILDNCEHVITAARGLARRLIEVDGLVVLATSRHVLGVRGEHVYPVEPLDRTGGAVELFVDRARDRDPRFELNEDTESAVIEICHRLDGMPLAIELAAARTGALSPRGIAARLDDRFRLLRGGRDGGRAHTLRDTVQWSYELLSEPEAALFERLAVFAGSFDLAAVEAVCADGKIVDELDVLDLLANLVDQSMVQRVRGSDERFRLLETLRQFAVEQLAERGGADQLRDRHADHFARYAGDLDRLIFGPGETKAWAAFDADWDNTRAAVLHHLHGGHHQRAAGMICDAFVYAFYSLRFEIGDWAEQLLVAADLVEELTLWRVRAVQAWTAWTSGDMGTAITQFEGAAAAGMLEPVFWFQAIAAFIHHGDQARAARAVAALAHAPRTNARASVFAAIASALAAAAAGSDTDEAVRLTQRVSDLSAVAGYQSGVANGVHLKALALRRADPPASRRAAQAAIDIAGAVHPDHLLVDAGLNSLAQVTAFNGGPVEALRCCHDAVASAARSRYTTSLAVGLQYAAVALARAGQAQTAAALVNCLRANGHHVAQSSQDVIDQYTNHTDSDPMPTPHTLFDAAELAITATSRAAATPLH